MRQGSKDLNMVCAMLKTEVQRILDHFIQVKVLLLW